MSEGAWLKKVLEDAKVAKQQWPEWAKGKPMQPQDEMCREVKLRVSTNATPAAS